MMVTVNTLLERYALAETDEERKRAMRMLRKLYQDDRFKVGKDGFQVGFHFPPGTKMGDIPPGTKYTFSKDLTPGSYDWYQWDGTTETYYFVHSAKGFSNVIELDEEASTEVIIAELPRD